MNLSEVPEILDGARVLSVAPARVGQVGYDYETGAETPVCYYSITQYVGSEPRAYLFAVSADHSVIGDSLWDTPEEAEQVALNSGNISNRFEPRSGR